MAGFQLTLHGRIWVTPEGKAKSHRKLPQKNSTAIKLKRHVFVLEPRIFINSNF
jgi:hypothetical protein